MREILARRCSETDARVEPNMRGKPRALSYREATMATGGPSLPLINPLAAEGLAIIIALLLLRRRRTSQRRNRRWWVKELFRQRMEYGNRLMRDMRMELVDDTIRNFTRMTSEDFDFLLSLVRSKIEKEDTYWREAITARERLAITLRFLATGDSFTSLQYLFRVSISSISIMVGEVCEAIIQSLQDYVLMPKSEEEWLQKAREFEDKWSFPHAIAAMDGKHVMLNAPTFSGTEYYNYKGFFSIVLFALVDANYNFIFVNVGCQGRISDGGVFKNATLYEKLERNQLNIPQPCALQVPYNIQVLYMVLADKAFALNDYTIKPFDGNPEVGSPQRVFNYRHSRARRVVENGFGIVSAVFRVLRKPMALQPERASKVVLATIYLHNFLRQRPSSSVIYTPPGTFDSKTDGAIINGRWRHDQPVSSLLNIRNMARRSTDSAKNVRLHLAHHFVLNDPLPWLNEY